MDSSEPLHLFASSLLIGLSIAVPVGPIGLLVIQRSLDQGPRAGLAAGMGAAAADAVYGAIGAYGVHWLTQSLVSLRVPLTLCGTGFLLWTAWQLMHAPAGTKAAAAAPSQGVLHSFLGTWALTLSNPATILSFVALFGALAGRSAVSSPGMMVAGVLAGSALWWLLLSALVGRLRGRFDPRWQRATHRVSAAMLTGFALWQLVSLAR
jgi:threonine/homoserine/homoserine lactone efflux protein